MALIEINKNPSKTELNVFGLLLLLFAGLVGGVVYYWTSSLDIPKIIWGVGAALTAVYYAVPPIRRPLYLGWMYAAYPIGFTISHLILGAVYYLMIAPFGKIMGAMGRDPMRRTIDRSRASYWEPHQQETDNTRYFRQF